MPCITSEDLLRAIKAGGRFDGPTFLKEHDRWVDHDPLALPPWIMPFQPPIQRSGLDEWADDLAVSKSSITAKYFELWADRAAQRALSDQEARGKPEWPQVTKSCVVAALAMAVSILEAEPVAESSAERLLMRTGLQLFGVEIIPDLDDSEARPTKGPLDLVNCDFAFSLRLICCVVRVPLAFSNLNLVTLDLSGSALVGVDASWLRAQGSVRLRRSYSSAPIDFAGAQIHGYFDATDILLQPFGRLPVGQSVDGDRGVLNLNQASIDNEIRLVRAFIWGGLSMRGLKTERSIFLDEARLLSPLGVLEELLFAKLELSGMHADRVNRQAEPKLPARPGYAAFYDSLQQRSRAYGVAEFARSFPSRIEDSCLAVLIRDGMKVRTSALRGDGVQVSGSIFAKNVLCVGRLRLKYANVSGSLTLIGSSLSSAERQRDSFDANDEIGWVSDLIDYRIQTYEKLVDVAALQRDRIAVGSDDFALDLREAVLGGSLRIGTTVGEGEDGTEARTAIDGVVTLDRAKIDGDVVFGAVAFSWTCRLVEAIRNANGGHYDKARPICDNERDRSVLDGEKYAINARGLSVGGDVIFNNASGINGLDFSYARIGGAFSIFREMTRYVLPVPENVGTSPGRAPTSADLPPELISVPEMARNLRGRFALVGARIGGDCRVVFDRDHKLTLKAERIDVAGALIISPQVDARLSVPAECFTMREADYKDQRDKDATRRRKWREAAANGNAAFEQFENSLRGEAKIDLGNAKVGLLHHPPPAWPLLGRLRITGLTYERALAYGPLCPHPFAKTEQTDGGRDGAHLVSILDYLKSNPNWFSLAIILVTIILTDPTGLFSQIKHEFSLFYMLLLAAITFANYFYSDFSNWLLPPREATNPMAVDWLELQEIKRNAYRTKLSWSSFADLVWHSSIGVREGCVLQGNVYHSLQPYSTAARALRDEGRWVSANRVDYRRIIVRDWQLSWRSSLFQKLFSRGLDLTSNHGFNFNRPFLIVTYLIAIASMVASSAGHHGAISEKFDNVRGVSEVHAKAHNKPVCPTTQTETPEGFTSLVYALEQIVPGLGMGQENDWELNKSSHPFCGSLEWITYERIFLSLHLLGFIVTGLMLVAISTRLSFSISSYKE